MPPKCSQQKESNSQHRALPVISTIACQIPLHCSDAWFPERFHASPGIPHSGFVTLSRVQGWKESTSDN